MLAFITFIVTCLFSFQLKLTPQYLEQIKYNSIASNTKIFFGPSIPSIFLDSKFFTKPSSISADKEQPSQEVCCVMSKPFLLLKFQPRTLSGPNVRTRAPGRIASREDTPRARKGGRKHDGTLFLLASPRVASPVAGLLSHTLAFSHSTENLREKNDYSKPRMKKDLKSYFHPYIRYINTPERVFHHICKHQEES